MRLRRGQKPPPYFHILRRKNNEHYRIRQYL